jgi:GDP-L-fucose synthase
MIAKNSKIYIAWHNWLVWSAILRKLKNGWYKNIVVRNHLELDLLNQLQVNEFFAKESPNVVILCAAKVWWVAINSKYPFEMLNENIQIENNVINAANKYWVNDLVFFASSTIYPMECEQPINEIQLFRWELDPLHESYGLSKIVWIKLCEKICREYSRNYFTLVPTNIYGIWDHFEWEKAHVIWSLMNRFYNAKINWDKEISVWWTGNALREFVFADDVADACLYFLNNWINWNSYINIWTEDEISIKDLAYMIKEIVWYEWKIIFDVTKPEWRLRRKLDNNLAQSLWRKAKTSLKIWLQQMYKYFLETK